MGDITGMLCHRDSSLTPGDRRDDTLEIAAANVNTGTTRTVRCNRHMRTEGDVQRHGSGLLHSECW